MIHTIDLNFLDTPKSIAVYLIEDAAGYTMVECGPYSTHDNLLDGLEDLDITPDDVHTLLLTHIHFDHAGAAWWWAARGTKVYVHPKGHRHLLDPERLYNSARQIYGKAMDKLWGEMKGIAPEQLSAVADREVVSVGGQEWVAHHTPGHAKHHIAWQLGDSVFTGDVGGAKIGNGPVVPPCPPPDIDAAAWRSSIERLASLEASSFYLTHFGRVTETKELLAELGDRLELYVLWMQPFVTEGVNPEEVIPQFTSFVEQDLLANGATEEQLPAYRAANPPYMSVAGLYRYWGIVKGK